jgi:hypothetical protein
MEYLFQWNDALIRYGLTQVFEQWGHIALHWAFTEAACIWRCEDAKSSVSK